MPHDATTEDGRRGRPLLALFLYLLAVFAGGALLAPWLYHALQALAPGTELARTPFARVVNRALLLVALLGVPFYVRASGIRRWADVGLDPRRIRWRRVTAGFALGFGSLAAVCGIALAMGARTLTARTPGQLAAQFLGALATALLVAVIEELLFRGAIFGGLRRAMPWMGALVLSSAIYAIVHFMARPSNPPEIGWLSGLRVLPTMLAGMLEPGGLVPAFLNLTLAGMILGLAYVFTGDVLTSIGIHAGWIFWLKFYGFLTRAVPGTDPVFWGTRKLVDGWLAFVALVVVMSIVLVIARRGRLAAGSASAASRVMSRLTLAEVEAAVKQFAARLGEPTDLPTFGYSVDFARPHVEVDGRGYHYVVVERGLEQRRDTTTSLDELLYLIFRDATFGIAISYELAHRVAGQDFRRILFREQVELISRLSPAWGERRAAEQREILRQHPFDDIAEVRVEHTKELRRQGHDDATAWAMACQRYPLPEAEG